MTFPRDTLTTQGLSLWSLNIVGGEILTFPDRTREKYQPLFSHCEWGLPRRRLADSPVGKTGRSGKVRKICPPEEKHGIHAIHQR